MNVATMDTAPRSGKALTITEHRANGLDRTYVVTRRALLTGLGVVVVGFLLFGPFMDAVSKKYHREEFEAMRPKMELLAGQGQDEAALWLSQHYFEENKQRLAALAAKGNAEAMFMQGVRMRMAKDGSDAAAMALIERAAAMGYAPAMTYVEHDIHLKSTQ